VSRETQSAAAAAAAGGEIAVPGWDWPVRAVHWAIVALLAVLLATAFAGNEWLVWHMRAGETVLALVLFRILWGFAGSRHARFSAFVRGPGRAFAYARSLIRPSHAIYAGHNPLGGWMVVALLLALLVQAGLGLFTNDDVLYEGPFVRYVSKELSDTLSTLHRRNAWVVITLASAHILAALAYLAAFRENLITPMVTGDKLLPAARASEATGATPHGRALVLLALCAIAVWLAVRRW
jgi:cytochrome b